MRCWSYGINGYYKTASIWLWEAPFYIFLLDWLADCICELIPAIPFPKLPLKLNAEETEWNEGQEWTTWQDWYGDLSQFVHCHFHNPIFHFCQTSRNEKWVEIGYKRLKKMFYEEDKEFWDDEERLAEEIREEEKKKLLRKNGDK